MNDLYRDAADEVPAAGFTFDNDALQRALKRIYEKNFHPLSEIEENLFDETFRAFTEATDEGLAESGQEIETEFRRKLDYNNAAFSAFKVHRMQNDIAAQLYDSNGDLKSFEQWKNDVHPMLDHHVGHWLRTEYNTAVIRSRRAADWQRFEREKDILPNLEWMPSVSVHPGVDHKIYWGVILPVGHPFWKQHCPGDRWNCKCRLESTDAPATAVPHDDNPKANRPAPGLDNNPGIDGKLFSDSHPYVAHAYGGAEEAVSEFMAKHFPDRLKVKVEPRHDQEARYSERTKEIRKEAAILKEDSFTNKIFGKEIHITGRGIKEWLNQPHMHYAHKNELILSLKRLLAKAKYLGYGPDKHDPAVKTHLFEVEILNDKSWIVVREFSSDRIEVHSISDSPNILKLITEKPTS